MVRFLFIIECDIFYIKYKFFLFFIFAVHLKGGMSLIFKFFVI